MKRQHKYRAWDIKNKTWIKPKFGGEICVGDGIVIVRDFKPNSNGGYSFDETREYFTSECIVVQSTGREDKNGKEIFDGDVLKKKTWDKYGKRSGSQGLKIVRWQNSSNVTGFNIASGIENWEIIGNAYSNPELIKREVSHENKKN